MPAATTFKYYTNVCLGWMFNHKLIVFLSLLSFCLFVSTLAIAGQRNRLTSEVSELKEELANATSTTTPEPNTTIVPTETTTNEATEATTTVPTEITTNDPVTVFSNVANPQTDEELATHNEISVNGVAAAEVYAEEADNNISPVRNAEVDGEKLSENTENNANAETEDTEKNVLNTVLDSRLLKILGSFA